MSLALGLSACGQSDPSGSDVAGDYARQQFTAEAETWVSANEEVQRRRDDIEAECTETGAAGTFNCVVTAGPELEGRWRVVVRGGEVERGEMVGSNLEDFGGAYPGG